MSKNNESSSSNNGIGFFGLLTIVFITLKLLGVINWSWVWVLAPIWLTFTIVAIILILVAIIGSL